MSWYINDFIILLVVYGIHSLGTTAAFKSFINKITGNRGFLWNFIYSLISVISIVFAVMYWKHTNQYLWKLSGIAFYLVCALNVAAVVTFLYLFKFTQPFTEWLGVKQAYKFVSGQSQDKVEGYRVKRRGIKRYIRFPHHTCLFVVFWALPVMTTDLLLLAIVSSIYIYLGTLHQDMRGYSYFSDKWLEYRRTSRLLFPAWEDVFADLGKDSNEEVKIPQEDAK